MNMNPISGRTLLLLLALTPVACGSMAARNAETAAAEALISSEQENQIGAQVKAELEQKQGIQYVPDPVITNYVNAVAGKVIAVGKKDRRDVNWQVHVINDPKQVNAFATPGGYLYVYTGLLAAAENEAELAGVMAHETAHVVARHSARRLVSAYGFQAVAAMALGQNPGLLGQVAGAVAIQGALLKNSRRDETEADELGARYAHGAGYDPAALATFFQKLKAKEGSTPGVLKYFATHPATGDRIAHINSFSASKGLTGGALNAQQYAQMKARIASLPAPTGVPAGGAPPSAPGGGAPPSAPGGAPPSAPPSGAPPTTPR